VSDLVRDSENFMSTSILFKNITPRNITVTPDQDAITWPGVLEEIKTYAEK
jgi:hypothetical protein